MTAEKNYTLTPEDNLELPMSLMCLSSDYGMKLEVAGEMIDNAPLHHFKFI